MKGQRRRYFGFDEYLIFNNGFVTVSGEDGEESSGIKNFFGINSDQQFHICVASKNSLARVDIDLTKLN